MIKLKKKLKRKNPKLKYEVEEILSNFYPDSNDIKVEYLNKGYFAHVYKVKLTSRKLYNNVILIPGTYAVKILLEPSSNDNFVNDWKPLTESVINRLKLLSKYGLIPEIKYIDKNVIISKFIPGKRLDEILDSSKKLSWREFESIIEKIKKLHHAWKKLGLQHGDIHDGNILITDSGKLYFIDPMYRTPSYKNTDHDQIKELETAPDILKKLDFSNIK